MEFEWDKQKRITTIVQHGVDFRDALLIFEGPVITRIDDRKDYGELRLISVGWLATLAMSSSTPHVATRHASLQLGRVDSMKESNIERASLAEIRKMKNEGKLSPPGPGLAEELPEDFWEDAVLSRPGQRPVPVQLLLEPEVFAFFKAQGKGHITRMQNVLKAYVKAHTK